VTTWGLTYYDLFMIFTDKNMVPKMKRQSKFRLLNAIENSMDGFKAVWNHEAAFRQECYLAVLLIPVILFITISSIVKLLLGLLLLLLLAVEIINSALEAVVDRISLETHQQSKIAKDTGSAAVCIVIIMNVITWAYALYFQFTLFH
jgi:diacylglycerol kinase (ATP)